jgi:FtsP/CotA-like multicopper oxidase with cupredoxin domain
VGSDTTRKIGSFYFGEIRNFLFWSDTGHRFQVIALDGNPVPTRATSDALELGPAERVDALVEMNRAGVWILGDANDHDRQAGMGVVVEYAGQSGAPQWMSPAERWDYAAFGKPAMPPATEPERIPLVIEKKFAGTHWMDKWTINGKEFPHTDEIRVLANQRYRLIFDNRSDEAHPLHLHRHTFELMSGVQKDVVVVPPRSKVEADFTAANPGLTLLHCHQQMHMDYGFMCLIRYGN